MEVSVTRSFELVRGPWLRRPSEVFVLTATVFFSREERWAIDAHNLHHHVIFDRTPPWYFTSLKETQRGEERAQQDSDPFQWPWYLPRSVPQEWILTVAGLLENPEYAVTFDTAQELEEFEPRLLGAFAQLKHFLHAYGSRPRTLYRRF